MITRQDFHKMASTRKLFWKTLPLVCTCTILISLSAHALISVQCDFYKPFRIWFKPKRNFQLEVCFPYINDVRLSKGSVHLIEIKLIR